MRRRTMLIAMALGTLPGLAAAQGGSGGALGAERVAYGRAVAESWCANCHVVSQQMRGPAGDAAPPFAAVARLPSTTETALRVFLRTPHAGMPDYHLSQAELDGVIAYILSLRGS